MAEVRNTLCVLLPCAGSWWHQLPKGIWAGWLWTAGAGHHFGARESISCPASCPREMDVLGPIPVHKKLISPGYDNLLIKSWANVPGSKSGLCPAKNRESVPELGTFPNQLTLKQNGLLQLHTNSEPSKVYSFPRQKF